MPIDRAAPRRRLLLKGLAVAPLAVGVRSGLAHPAVAGEARTLSFSHTHTGERLRVVYFVDGAYQPGPLAEVEHLLRDFRTGDEHRIDPALLDTLYALCGACGGRTFEIISGYRSPQTNAMLRKTGGGGVATRSLHMDGRAIDVRLAGVDTSRLRAAGIALGRGGVGYYRDADFVHIDTGRPRTW
ncbi:MAG: DUF882 domain-containing protein [Burkholderiales bacterium]|nr:DUF882 domain-containing protein [Burkholderiales bacterium]